MSIYNSADKETSIFRAVETAWYFMLLDPCVMRLNRVLEILDIIGEFEYNSNGMVKTEAYNDILMLADVAYIIVMGYES